MDQNKITFIGFGNMGSAIYNGMQKSKLTNEVLIVDMGRKKIA
jgi:pyrroline-5-carboxylate reductase